MPLCLFFDIDEEGLSFLDQKPLVGYEALYFAEEFNSKNTQSLACNYNTVEVISVFPHSEVLKKDYLDLFPNLKLIVTRSTGFNHIDLNDAKMRHITVENVPNYGEITVAEFTIGILLGLSRKIYKAKSQMKSDNVHLNEYIGQDLCGRTLGVIGTGAIGRRVIELALAFRMNVLAFDPLPNPIVEKIGGQYVDLTTLYKESDMITLHCPATKENMHMLDKQAFTQMKKGVLIVNTARGSLIKTQSLYSALKSGKVGGAGLDVLENEDVITHREISTEIDQKDHSFLIDSLINFKMMQLDNTIITPHIAFNSIDAVHRILKTSIDNINAFAKNKIINAVG